MVLLKIAFRNVLRNARRSAMTAAAIAIGAVALILLGEYRAMAVIGLETGAVRDGGHLTIVRQGYFDYGAGQPGVYGIADYDAVIAMIKADPVLKPLIAVATPIVSLGGIAGNAGTDRSKTFFGSGFVPSDRDRMRRWDEYRLYTATQYAPYPLTDADVSQGVVGQGLAHILGVGAPGARLELLSGSSGAPNVVAVTVAKVQSQGAKDLNDSYVGLNLKLAQQLLYGSGTPKAGAIVVQLKRTEDIDAARGRLAALFAARRLDLEVRDFRELSPFFTQILTYQLMLFGFISAILFVIIAFTIANTMGMSVMERVREIGTARAMGARRSLVRRQFLAEGAILGSIGAGAGTLIAVVATVAINHAGIRYHMPISASAIPLYLMDEGVWNLRAGVFLSLAALAMAASILPAVRAARMTVADALRHV